MANAEIPVSHILMINRQVIKSRDEAAYKALYYRERNELPPELRIPQEIDAPERDSSQEV